GCDETDWLGQIGAGRWVAGGVQGAVVFDGEAHEVDGRPYAGEFAIDLLEQALVRGHEKVAGERMAGDPVNMKHGCGLLGRSASC
ncbi:hypothetical protein M3697_17835, partial [Janibacter melonis]|uniref:hypothetical protein n=1 Tax=Janibacter melonis TaxID=262209 RepID=UPI00204439F1